MADGFCEKSSSMVEIGHTENGDQGMAGFKAGREGLLNAFPDMHVEVEDTAADGDHVMVGWRVRGTHRGPLSGLQFLAGDMARMIRWLAELVTLIDSVGNQDRHPARHDRISERHDSHGRCAAGCWSLG